MSIKKSPPVSQYDLFRGKFTFTTEPPWLRLVLCILPLATVIILAFVMGQYAFSAVISRWIAGIKRPTWLKAGKTRSP